jgi:hypothetical protein
MSRLFLKEPLMRAYRCPISAQICAIPILASTLFGPNGDMPEARAIAFLAREIPQWSPTHNCFSCHNNGDAARALYTAKRLGFTIPPKSLEDTTAWLTEPKRWEHNGGNGEFNDRRLARVQFAAALQIATESGAVQNSEPLVEAAIALAMEQSADGSWLNDSTALIGSPATYGRPLATFMARETLKAADSSRFATNIQRAESWLRSVKIHNVMDAAVVLLASAGPSGPDWIRARADAFALLKHGQADDGGWGPFVTAVPEPFDTALVLLALSQNMDSFDCLAMMRHGREFLIASQLPDGSWNETTRPSGAESYAQRISTTGWATLALLATR